MPRRWAPQLFGSPALIFFGARTGPPGATVGVLISGVPQFTGCAAHLWPTVINKDKSYIDKDQDLGERHNLGEHKALADGRPAGRNKTQKTKAPTKHLAEATQHLGTQKKLHHQGFSHDKGGDVAPSPPRSTSPTRKLHVERCNHHPTLFPPGNAPTFQPRRIQTTFWRANRTSSCTVEGRWIFL